MAGVFLALGWFANVRNEPKCADAQCVSIGGLDTGSLDHQTKGSAAESALISAGCVRLNNASYTANQWMSCPTRFYMAAITDNDPAFQDAFCCPLMP